MESHVRPTPTHVNLMTLAEAAQFLRLNPRTLESWSRGPCPRLPVIRIGRKVLFYRAALEAWLKTCTVKPQSATDPT